MRLHSTATAGSAILFAALCAGSAHANCLASKATLAKFAHRTPAAMMAKAAQPAAPKAEDATFPEVEPSIAGYWYIRFTVEGQLVDDGFDVWHNDGSETLNDTTPPAAGAVCLGIWTRTDHLTFTLKHPSWLYDDTNTNLVGIAMIQEQVKIDPSGNTFSGTCTVDVYDLSGNLLDQEVSDVSATRINALNDASALKTPIPGLPAVIVKR